MRDLREIGSNKRLDAEKEQDVKLPIALLATAGYDHRIYLWHPKTGDIYKEYEHDDSQVNCLKFSVDGRLLAVTGYEVLRVYDVHSNSPLTIMSNNLVSNSKNITCVGFNRTDSTSLITGGEDGCCRLWEFPRRNLKHAKEVNCSKKGVINCLSTNHPKFGAVVGTQMGYILGWNIAENNISILYHMKTISIQSIDCHHGDGDKEIRIVAISNNGVLIYQYDGKWFEVKVHDKYGLCCIISPDGKSLATGGADAKIKLYRFEQGKLFEVHQFCDSKLKWVWDLQFSLDMVHLFAASSDGVVQMWSLEDKTVKRSYRGHQKSVVSLALFQQKPRGI